MKRAFVIAALMLQPAAFAGQAVAQSDEPQYLRLPHQFQIFVEGGGSLPTQPGVWNDLWNSAFELTIGAGVSIFSWLDVNGGFTTSSFTLNTIQAKGVIGYTGIQEVKGGTISMNQFYGSARFIAVPSARTNPYVEAAVGYYTTSAENVTIEGWVDNSMEPASGLSMSGSVGIQYSLASSWSSYARYTYMVNFSDTYAPGNLLQPEGGGREVTTGNQVIQNLGVGIMVLF